MGFLNLPVLILLASFFSGPSLLLYKGEILSYGDALAKARMESY